MLETYLYRAARGELADLAPVVPLIPPSIFYFPSVSENTTGLTYKFRVPLIRRNGKEYLPVFLKRSHLLSSYEKDSISAQEVRGEHILNNLPGRCGLMFEPNTSLEVKFDREDLKSVLSDDFEGSVAKIGLLEADLTTLFHQFNGVQEAFILEHHSDNGEIILGILFREPDQDRRYVLKDEIAKISVKHYGYAGAIDVFDDLDSPESVAWHKFKRSNPFYAKANITDRLEISKTVVSNSKPSTKHRVVGGIGGLKLGSWKVFN